MEYVNARTGSKRLWVKASDKVHVPSTNDRTLIGVLGQPALKAVERRSANKTKRVTLNVTPNVGVSQTCLISNSLGFGGHNAVICVKKWKDIRSVEKGKLLNDFVIT